jgi:hypothetical protein
MGNLQEKFDQFAPGVPDDAADLPTTRYQVLEGRVFTLTVWRNAATARGEVAVADLEQLRGEPVTRDGWYDETGAYLGDEAGL